MSPSFARASGLCLIAAAWLALLSPAHAQIVNPPGGTTVTWTDDGLNGQWDDDDNWNVHVPEEGDAVIIDDGVHNVILQSDAETLRSLFVAGGIGLYNDGFRLPVANAAGDATTTITGNGSQIIVSDIPGTGAALDTDYLDLLSGGTLQMDGGRAQVDREIDMSGASSIEGHGLLEVGGAGAAALGFSPTSELKPENGNLRIDMTGGGTIALGGAYIDVTDDNSDLILEGNLFGPIADTLRIGAGNTVDLQGNWELSGTLQFVSGGGEVVGGLGNFTGDIVVNNGASGRIDSAAQFAASAQTTVNALGTLEIVGGVTSNAAHVATLGNASTLRFQLPSSLMGSPQLVWAGEIDATAANIEAVQAPLPSNPGILRLTGNVTLGGSEFWGPSDLTGTAPIHLEGDTTVEGAGGRIQGAGVQFSSSSQTTIANGSRLEIQSSARLNAAADILGAGELRVANGGLLFAEDNAVIDTELVNHGVVRPGAGSDYSAHLEVDDTYLQFETGELEIDIAGTLASQYDRLVVNQTATLDGSLQVTLRNGFVPELGDDFLVLSSGSGVAGTFAQTLLPSLDSGLRWDVDYSPFAVTLSVIEATADADGDGDVDGADFLIIQQQLGTMGPSIGDVTGDSMVDGADYDLWRAQFGTTVGGTVAAVAMAAQAVPEPTAGVIAMALAAVLTIGGRRRKA